jgi:tetratricopeptide (TPR) repeat protein
VNEQAANHTSNRGALWGAIVLIVLAVLAAYRNSFSGPFIFDDIASIVDNPTIRRLWPVSVPLWPPFSGGQTVGGRPILNLSLAVNYAWGGADVRGYHAVNLGIHILAALTLFGIVRRTLERAKLADGRAACPGRALPAALVVALLWALHPLQTESVTYIIQRAESLMGLFYLLTLYCFIRFTERRSSFVPLRGTSADEEAGGVVWAWLSVVCCLLGMATKEVMVSAPIMVFLYDRTFVSGTLGGAWRRHGRIHLALASTWLPLGTIVLAAHDRGGSAGFGHGVSWWDYALTQFPAIVHYLRLAVWPHPLIFDYGAEWVRRPWEAAPAAALVLALAAATLHALLRPASWGRFGRAFGFAGVWFFAILAPTSLVPGNRQTLAEHRMYLALVPIVALAVCGASAWIERGNRALKISAAAAALAVAVAYGVLTERRNADYRSFLTLWTDTAAKCPGNPFAHNNVGVAWYQRQDLAKARAQYDEALRLRPDFPEACVNLGNVLRDEGRVPEALEEFDRALRLDPEYAEAYNNRGIALTAVGRRREAVADFAEAIRLKPDYADAHVNLGNAFGEEGKFSDAAAQFEEALRNNPRNAEAWYDLGNIRLITNRPADAIVAYRKALQEKPRYPEALTNLGNALVASKQAAEAIGCYEEALRLQPDFADAHYDLGLTLRTLGRPDEARAHFEEAARLRAGH